MPPHLGSVVQAAAPSRFPATFFALATMPLPTPFARSRTFPLQPLRGVTVHACLPTSPVRHSPCSSPLHCNATPTATSRCAVAHPAPLCATRSTAARRGHTPRRFRCSRVALSKRGRKRKTIFPAVSSQRRIPSSSHGENGARARAASSPMRESPRMSLTAMRAPTGTRNTGFFWQSIRTR